MGNPFSAVPADSTANEPNIFSGVASMVEMQDYQSSLTDVSSRKFETFSYLPSLSDEQVRAQVEYIISKGWNPAVEHTEPENATDTYWYMWKLPMFGETDVERVLAEAEACHKAHPNNHVRLIGYDNYAQSQGTAMVIFRGTPV
jgi:ribulose-bisphosphate carboxylase small chain